jgi:hypothetical protein
MTIPWNALRNSADPERLVVITESYIHSSAVQRGGTEKTVSQLTYE